MSTDYDDLQKMNDQIQGRKPDERDPQSEPSPEEDKRSVRKRMKRVRSYIGKTIRDEAHSYKKKYPYAETPKQFRGRPRGMRMAPPQEPPQTRIRDITRKDQLFTPAASRDFFGNHNTGSLSSRIATEFGNSNPNSISNPANLLLVSGKKKERRLY